MVGYLVESALLTHGLSSITENELIKRWPGTYDTIAWMQKGRLTVGGIDDFCKFRRKAAVYGRVNRRNYDSFKAQGRSGALTAWGTMRACEELGITLAVTCGMGGLMKGQRPEESHDLEALAAGPVSLLAAAPKDMFDLKRTILAMEEAGITILGYESDVCDGYIFAGECVNISGRWNKEPPGKRRLFLKAIERADRIADKEILNRACRYGEDEEAKGRYYHPAVNKKVDELTGGVSSALQLGALIENIAWAEQLMLIGE